MSEFHNCVRTVCYNAQSVCMYIETKKTQNLMRFNTNMAPTSSTPTHTFSIIFQNNTLQRREKNLI
jgi:hypothetical protein